MIEFGLPSTRSSHLNPHFSISAPVASSSDSSVFSVLEFPIFSFPISIFAFPFSRVRSILCTVRIPCPFPQKSNPSTPPPNPS